MLVQLQKTDKGFLITVPEDMAQASKFGPDSMVNITLENGRLVVADPDDPHYTIEELLEGMTAENLHEEITASQPRRSKYRLEDLMARVTEENLPDKIDFGPPVGRELL